MTEYKRKWGRLFYLEEDILCVEYIDDYTVDVEDNIEFHALFEKEAQTKKKKLLVMPGENTGASREAREYSQNTIINSAGEAIIIKSLAQRIIANFYISFKNKADYPIKMFNSKDEAVKWLKSL